MSERSTALLIAAALLFVAPEAAAQVAGAPRLTLSEPVQDAGVRPKGEGIVGTFPVRNTGNADLVILAAQAGCGCAVVDFDKVIAPGATGKVTVRIDTGALAGPIAKSVTLQTNDPATPVVQLSIRAVVKPYVDAYPAGYVRFNLLQSAVEKQAVTLYSEDAGPLEITAIESPVGWIKVEKIKLGGSEVVPGVGRAGQNQYRLEVTLGGAGIKPGPISQNIRVMTNSKYQPEFLLSVSGVVRPDYRVEPTAINFGEVAPADTAATRTIRLRSNDLKASDSFTVARVVSEIPGVTAAVRPTANRGEYEVVLQVTRQVPPGAFAGNVTIHTSARAKPVVIIPVKGIAKP